MEQQKKNQTTGNIFDEIGTPIDIGRVINDPHVLSNVFSDFSMDELSIICSVAKAYQIEKDQDLFYENEQGNYLCIVASGLLEVVKKGIISEESRAVAEISAGMVFGEISLMDSLPYSASVVTRYPTKLITIKRDDFELLAVEQPNVVSKLQAKIGEIMGKRLRITTSHLVEHFEQSLVAATARDEALQDSQRKADFLAQVSHEIRNPLSAIIGYCDIIREDLGSADDAAVQDDLKSILAISRHLNSLINDLLDLSKSEAGKMDLYYESCDVKELVSEVVTIVNPLMQNNGIEFEMDVANDVGVLCADVTRTSQILINLLTNAAKFARGKSVALKADREMVEGKESIVFKVIDTGIGMTQEQVDKVFQKYKQASTATAKQFGGTGLGLSLSLSLSKLMGGDMQADSTQGRGSVFSLILPVNQPTNRA